jgi:acyl carrier protein
MEALWRIVSFSTVPQVVVSKVDLERRLDVWVRQSRQYLQRSVSQPPLELVESVPEEPTKATSVLEKSLSDIWKALLGIEEIGNEESFLNLGGDSLVALRIIARVRERAGITLTPTFFLEPECTVSGLAREIVAKLKP